MKFLSLLMLGSTLGYVLAGVPYTACVNDIVDTTSNEVKSKYPDSVYCTDEAVADIVNNSLPKYTNIPDHDVRYNDMLNGFQVTLKKYKLCLQNAGATEEEISSILVICKAAMSNAHDKCHGLS